MRKILRRIWNWVTGREDNTAERRELEGIIASLREAKAAFVELEKDIEAQKEMLNRWRDDVHRELDKLKWSTVPPTSMLQPTPFVKR